MTNRHQRRRDASHLRLARPSGDAPEPSRAAKPIDPNTVPWCIHERREMTPRFAIGTRVRYSAEGPIVVMRGAQATVVGASQRLCRLLGPVMWKKAVCVPQLAQTCNRFHDEPAYWLDHLELADGRTHLDSDELAFPVWATEAWLVEIPRLVLAT